MLQRVVVEYRRNRQLPPEVGMACPTCGIERYQVRDGKTAAGSQRLRCSACGKRYTPQPKAQGYEPAIKAAALRMVTDGYQFAAC